MQGAFDAGAVVVAEVTDALGDVFQVVVGHLDGVEDGLTVGETRLRLAAEVEDYLEQVATALLRQALRGTGDAGWKCFDEEAELLLP